MSRLSQVTPIVDAVAQARPHPEQPAPMPPEAMAHLEAAARSIVEMLPRALADYVYETAYVTLRQPLWTVVAGHLARAYEEGAMTAPILDPGWGRHFGTVGLDLAAERYQCEECDATFVPTRYRQRFCTQACGAAAAKKVP